MRRRSQSVCRSFAEEVEAEVAELLGETERSGEDEDGTAPEH